MTGRPRAAVAALAGATAVAFLDLTAVSVALPAIRNGLAATSAHVQWVMTAYFLALAVAVAAGGRAADLLGARRALLGALAAFACSSALAAVAPALGWLVAARFAQGLAAALLIPAAQGLAVQAFGRDRVGGALGAIVGLGSLAVIVGPLLGGALVETLGWRGVFLVNVPVAAVIAAAALHAFDPSPRLRAAGGARGFLAPLRRASFAGSLAVVFLLQFAPVAVIVYGALFLQDEVGLSPLETGLAVLPATLAFLAASVAGGRLADARSARLPTVAGALLMAASLGLIAVLLRERSLWPLMPGLAGFGTGLGLCAAPVNAALLATAGRDAAAGTAGLIATVRQVGSALASAGLGAAAVAAGTAAAMGIAAGASLLAALLAVHYVPRHDSRVGGRAGAGHPDQRDVPRRL